MRWRRCPARNSEIPAIENQSDFENFFELPDESFEVRAMEWFHEGLMLATERSIMFVWGSKPEEFRPANTSTYGFGLFHRNGFLVTTHGLVMFTDDRKIVLDPIITPGTTPGPAERTGHVIDLGWPVQPDLDQTDIRFTNRFQMRHWKQGSERDWLVIAYTTQNIIDGGTSHLLIYDFEVNGWISFDDVAATCIGIVEEDEGFQFLLAGNSVADRELRVVTDFTSVAASPYQAADTALVAGSRYGNPAGKHLPQRYARHGLSGSVEDMALPELLPEGLVHDSCQGVVRSRRHRQPGSRRRDHADLRAAREQRTPQLALGAQEACRVRVYHCGGC